ncbi:MAG: GNAT family N-acetyltransferase, partial [Planktomarina sp.]
DRILDAAFTKEDIVSFLAQLRAEGALLQGWVAAQDGCVVGHIAFAKGHVETRDGSYDMPMLTPLSVRVDLHGQGIGSTLINQAHSDLASDYRHTCVLGHPTYYPRFGYEHYAQQPVASPWSQYPAFMIRGLHPVAGTWVGSKTILEG